MMNWGLYMFTLRVPVVGTPSLTLGETAFFWFLCRICVGSSCLASEFLTTCFIALFPPLFHRSISLLFSIEPITVFDFIC